MNSGLPDTPATVGTTDSLLSPAGRGAPPLLTHPRPVGLDPVDIALRPVGAYLPAVLAEFTRTPLVRRVDGGFDILDPSLPDFVYELDDEVLRDASSAMFWIRQLGEKSWVTKQHLVDLAQAVMDHMESEGGRRR